MNSFIASLPIEQQLVRAKCIHPTGCFVTFEKDDVNQSIPERFEQQVLKNPDRIAIHSSEHRFTYEDLNREANRVAHAILARDAWNANPVALLTEQDAPGIAAMLGISKLGRIYVPLDTAHPPARQACLWQDSQASLLVTDARNVARAQELVRNNSECINIDELSCDLPTNNPGIPIAPDVPAYLLYTSGTTGQPKAALHSHRNLMHELRNYTNDLHISREDRIALLSSYGFLIGVDDILGALLNGASLNPFNLLEKGMGELAEWLIDQETTIFHSVPTVFRAFVNELTVNHQFPKLRVIYLGGEPVSGKDARMIRDRFAPDCILISGMGSTETGVFRRYFMDKKMEMPPGIIPVGYEVEDVEVLLRGKGEDQEAHDDHVGAITVRSGFLSLGYWQRPELTAAAFLPDPAGGGGRIYYTGDIGRMLPDGCLLCLGRLDSQLKIRGQKIELAEIRAALLNIEDVKETAIVAQEDRAGDVCVVAYVVVIEGATTSADALRRLLSELLPDYMVPVALVIVQRLPLTPTGKIDYGLLQSSVLGFAQAEKRSFEPRTHFELLVAGIWKDVLRLDRVGAYDSFFDLGGDSQTTMQAMAALQKATGLRINRRELMFQPLYRLAADLQERMQDSPSPLTLGLTRNMLNAVKNAIARKIMGER